MRKYDDQFLTSSYRKSCGRLKIELEILRKDTNLNLHTWEKLNIYTSEKLAIEIDLRMIF